MSESEVSKHIKRTYKIWKKPGINWKEKLTEIIMEILIIVFAVSLSLYLERWREKQHDRQIEKNFLTGLRNDLQNDIKEMSSDSIFYSQQAKDLNIFILQIIIPLIVYKHTEWLWLILPSLYPTPIVMKL